METLQEATKAREARNVEIIHLGLQPWEAIEMGLEVETIKRGERRKPVADYVRERDAEFPNEALGGVPWGEWLQTHRVELNAMTTPAFIAWLDGKMAEHGVGKAHPARQVAGRRAEAAHQEQGPRHADRAHPAGGWS